MITLYRYSFDVGYPKPYIHILACCEEEAIDKLKTLHPEIKWFELSGHPEVVKRIDTLYSEDGLRTYEQACETAIKYCLENLI